MHHFTLLILVQFVLGFSNDGPQSKTVNFKQVRVLGDELELSVPLDMAIHPKGTLIVDYKECLVTCYDKDWNPLFSFGKKGEGPGEFTRPINLFVDKDSIYIFDLGNYCLNQFDLTGKYITRTKCENRIIGIRSGGGITCYGYYHKENKPDFEIRSDKTKNLIPVRIKNADECTYYTVLAVNNRGIIFAAPINKYIIEVYDSTGELKKILRQDYIEPPKISFAPIKGSFTLAAVNGLAVNDQYLFILRGGHQALYQELSANKHLEEKYNNRIDVLDLNGKLVSYFWDPRLAVHTNGIYSSPIFKIFNNNSLFLQDPEDLRLIHNYVISTK